MKKNVLVSLAATALLGACVIGAPFSSANLSASAQSEKRYYDYTVSVVRATTSEYIQYTSKTDPETTTAYGMPFYYATGDLTNACGAVAGTEIVGFYDRYYENLIPNYTPYYEMNNRYRMQDNTYIPAVMQDMYTRMRTNVDDVGVSETDCKNGLKSYFTSKGLTLSYSSVKSGSSFSYSLYKQAIDANKPVLLFCTDLGITTVSYGNGEDTITTSTTTGSHIIVGYGYYTLNYYNNGTLFRTENFILAANGQSVMRDICVDISDTSWFDAGYAVSVS